MSLKKYRAQKQQENLQLEGERVKAVAFDLANHARGQAEMHDPDVDSEPHFANLPTRDLTTVDHVTGKNIIAYRDARTQMKPGFTFEIIEYRPTPYEMQSQAASIHEAQQQAETTTPRLHEAVRLSTYETTLTVDYGDGSQEPLVSARTLDEASDEGFRQATAEELETAFRITPENYS